MMPDTSNKTFVSSAGVDAAADPRAPSLTPRQRQILTMLCEGASNKEIGWRLGISVITVKMHVTLIYRALGVAKRVQAVLVAGRLGMIRPRPDAVFEDRPADGTKIKSPML